MNFNFSKKFVEINWIHIWMLLMFLCFMIVSFVSFINAPFTGDIEVFIAAENQVKYKEILGLSALFEAWELKGIGNRLLMYILYRLALIFVPYGHVVAFEFTVKVIYAIIVLFFIIVTSALISENMNNRVVIFVIEYLAVFCTYTASQLQAEMTCVVLSGLIFAFLVHGNRRSMIVSGILGGVLFLYKSVFLLLYFASLCGALVYKDGRSKRKNYIFSLISFGISEIIFIILIKFYYPQEFKDMAAAASFQTTLFSKESNIGMLSIIDNFQMGFTQASIGIPFLLMGVCSAVVLVIQYIRKKEWKQLTEIIFTWLFVLDIIVISNKYFLYHYFLLTLPCFICVLILIKNVKLDLIIISISGIVALCAVCICWILKDGIKQTFFINSSTVCLIITHLILFVITACFLSQYSIYQRISVFLVLTTCAFFYINYSSIIAPKYRNERMLLKQSEKACIDLFPKDFGDEPVLFLDDGTIPFYVDAPSYSRYFFNLPMQRWHQGDDWEIQKQEYEKLMQYDGKYIVYMSWFGIEKYPELKTKIETEYERIPESSIPTFSPNWDFFSLNNSLTMDTLRTRDDNYILIRK